MVSYLQTPLLWCTRHPIGAHFPVRRYFAGLRIFAPFKGSSLFPRYSVLGEVRPFPPVSLPRRCEAVMLCTYGLWLCLTSCNVPGVTRAKRVLSLSSEISRLHTCVLGYNYLRSGDLMVGAFKCKFRALPGNPNQ